MKVKLYKNFKKRKNSTLQPSGEYLEADCILKNGTSIVNPTIQLQLTFNSDYSNYNYCHIPDFGRFYYIRDLVWNNSIAEFVLVSDIMASFKSDIAGFTGLAVRASNSFDGTIPDPLLPPTDDIIITTTSASRPATYSYVIVGAGADGISIMPFSSLDSIGEQLNGIWAQITNQVSGINACYRTLLTANDFVVESIDPLTKYKVGFGAATFELQGERLSLVPSTKVFLRGLTLENHPQAETYGKFLNGANYRSVYLYNSGIGFIHLPTTSIDAGSITIEGTYAPDNGATALRVICFSTNHCLTQITTNLYAAVPFCGSSINIAGVASGVAGTAGGIGTALSATTPAGAISAGIGAGVSAISGAVSALPVGSVQGVLGGISSLDNVFSLVHIFRKVKDNDNNNRGRPLLKTLAASSGGYIEYERVNLATNARADEKSEIETTMERGFYYE